MHLCLLSVVLHFCLEKKEVKIQPYFLFLSLLLLCLLHSSIVATVELLLQASHL